MLHIRLRTGVFALETTEEAVEHLELLLSDMGNDKILGWFMQATQSTEVIALVKGEAQRSGTTTKHMLVHTSNKGDA